MSGEVDWENIFVPTRRYDDRHWMARCPAHEDRQASLEVRLGDKAVLLKCYAGGGCPLESICAAAGIKVSDLFYEQRECVQRQEKIIATYSYRDEEGIELYQVLRMEPKSFRVRRRAGGVWVWNMDGVRRIPYRLHELVANPLQSAVIVEGEKSADRLRSIGLLSTCSNGGAEKWDVEFGRFFTGRRVAILPDNDTPGIRHACLVAGSVALYGARSIRIVRLPGLPPKGDVYDFLEAGRDKRMLLDAICQNDPFEQGRTLRQAPAAANR